MHISYEDYLDKVLGGWIGKSMGGAIGARFEGNKGWIEIDADAMFPPTIPPNDDLDLQVLWLKVIEEKGAALTSDDLAQAWIEGCWYPFNEYGIFRRNWMLGIRPPMSGHYGNKFWETGMGCPIRAEIFGYVFPGAPDLAAHYAGIDGCLDHTEQAIGAEKLFAAMASMAFFVPDVRRLASMFLHYLPVGTPVERMTRIAFECHRDGVPMRDARDRMMAIAGNPEACDAQTNVPFTFLALLYGENDLQETLLAALRCGYDTDCTMATSAALLGQILGASRIPAHLKEKTGDELVMGIQYTRAEMTLSALARDTARMGVLLATDAGTGVTIAGAPALAPLPPAARSRPARLVMDYAGMPVAAPGETVKVTLRVEGTVAEGVLTWETPPGWLVEPRSARLGGDIREVSVSLLASAEPVLWPLKNTFTASLGDLKCTFGVAGAGLWKFLGVYFDALPAPNDPIQHFRRMGQHFVSLNREYLPEKNLNIDQHFEDWSRKLGRPAVIPSYEHEVDLTRLVGLTGAYCAYVAREIVSPVEQEVYIVVGNTDAFRLYLNGEPLFEVEETLCWMPFNNSIKATLRKGTNTLLVKLLKRTDSLTFTLGFRGVKSDHTYGGPMNWQDWLVNTADVVPRMAARGE